MAILLKQVDDFAIANEANGRKREENLWLDKGKGKEHEHQSGKKNVLHQLSFSWFTRAHSLRREHFTPLLKSTKEIYALTKVRGILRQPLKCRLWVIKEINITIVNTMKNTGTKRMTATTWREKSKCVFRTGNSAGSWKMWKDQLQERSGKQSRKRPTT